MTSADDLLRNVGLTVGGTVPWGIRVPSAAPGVYLVSTPLPMVDPPIATTLLQTWIQRLPAMRIDGQVATVDGLDARLRSFWIPGETVVYIGLAGTSMATRVGQFYRTPLGDRAPHAGGHWLKTLDGLDAFRVTWAASATPDDHEDALLRAFAEALPKAVVTRLGFHPVLPFANLETGGKARKAHGISGSRLPRLHADRTGVLTPRAPHSPDVPNAGRPGSGIGLVEINAAIQRLACAHPNRRVTAVEAAAELDQLGLLRDSPSRRGKPLRALLRDGAIEHSYQEGGRSWFIDCPTRGVT